jgi:eukaryotic-like serine/threonine-protein kinase
MTPERWQQVKNLFHSALERESNDRALFLEEACAGDVLLRREVESLIASHEQSGGFIDSPAYEVGAELLTEDQAETLVGQRLAHYEILALLGSGGMGEVYLAQDGKLGRKVALKLLPTLFTTDEDRLRRLEQEACAASALDHPNVCVIHEVGETADGQHFIVMEYVDGLTLRQHMTEARLKLSEVLDVAVQVVSGLAAAHAVGVVHRDIKPENIRVRSDAYVKVLDFGLAKLTEKRSSESAASSRASVHTDTGVVMGTSSYMSPEQTRGLSVDGRTDIWSLGVVIYEMMTGCVPFEGATTSDVIVSILDREPPPLAQFSPEAPAELQRIITKALHKDRDERYQTAKEMLSDLRGLKQRLEFEAKLECAAPPESSSPMTITHHPSIAILPFANMSADKENEYFGDGLAEEIINVLAQVPGMKVAGRTSSFFFREKDVEFGEIGRRLNVEHILEGSVRKAGNRIRVTAQLIKVTDGFHLWSERYDCELTDIFAIQDEMTQAIAAALRIRLSSEAATLRRHTPNLRAYAAYLEARDHWVRPTPESLARVKECLEHAIELDPEFALAHSLLGGHYTMLANLGLRPAREVIPLARAAEQEALRIEPSLPEAHALLGVCAGHDYEWNEAEREWRLAMAHEPVSRDVRFWYGNHYLLPMGRVVESVEAMARGLQEDPLNVLYRQRFAVGLRNAGRLEDAEVELRKILEIDENFPLAVGTLGAICVQQGRFEEALTLTERAYALTPWRHPIIGQLAALLVRAGDTSRADALLEKLGTGKEYGASTGLAVFYALCGELDRAAEWAEQAIEERYPRLVPILGPLLRPSPKWPALAKLMNLPG